MCRHVAAEPEQWIEVLPTDRPWEQGNGCLLWGRAVIFDESKQKYRMWGSISECKDMDAPFGKDNGQGLTVYAESDDGIAWTKPDLNLTDWKGDGGKNNLLELDGMTTGVYLDEETKDPQQRYKIATGSNGKGGLATSPDGITALMCAAANGKGDCLEALLGVTRSLGRLGVCQRLGRRAGTRYRARRRARDPPPSHRAARPSIRRTSPDRKERAWAQWRPMARGRIRARRSADAAG